MKKYKLLTELTIIKNSESFKTLKAPPLKNIICKGCGAIIYHRSCDYCEGS